MAILAEMKRQFAQLFVARSCASLFQVAAILYLGRLVGPSELGPIVAFIGLGAFLAAVSDFGIGTYLLKGRAANPENALLRPALATNDATTLLLVAVSVLGAILLGIQPAGAALLGLWIGLEKNTDTHLSIPTADGAIGVVSTINFMRRLIGLLLFVVLAGFTSAVLAFCVAQSVGAVYGLVHGRIVLHRSKHRVAGDAKPSFQTLRESFPFWVAVVSSQARELDSMIVGVVAGPGAAGLYGAGARLSRPALMVASALATVLLPSATKGDAATTRRTARGLYLLLVAGTLAGGGVALVADAVLPVILGNDFTSAVPTAQVLLVSMSIVALCAPLGGLLQARGGERFVALNGSIYATITVAALFVGTAAAGPVGAAIGVSLSYAAKFISLAVKLQRLTRPGSGNRD